MKIKDILGIILSVIWIFTIISMVITMSSGNIEQGREILAGAMAP